MSRLAAARGHGGGPLERVSFLARIVPQEPERRRAPARPVPRGLAELVRRLPLERKVGQLFLVGFPGTDLNAEIFRRLRRLDLGGIVIDSPTTSSRGCSGSSQAKPA